MQGLQMKLTQDRMYTLQIMYITHQVHLNKLISLMEIHQHIHQQVHHSMHIIIFIPIHLQDFSIKNIRSYQRHYPVTIIIQRHRTIKTQSLSLSRSSFFFIHFACVYLFFFLFVFFVFCRFLFFRWSQRSFVFVLFPAGEYFHWNMRMCNRRISFSTQRKRASKRERERKETTRTIICFVL